MTKRDAKRWLRKLAIKERQTLPAPLRQLWSRRIETHLLKSSYMRNARVVAVYLDFGSEVQTRTLVKSMWKRGKKIVIPISSNGFENSYFVLYKKGDALAVTTFGPEELKRPRAPFRTKEIDLIVMPGLGFDGSGGRLGYGGGVYDRLIERTPQAKSIGLFYSRQAFHRLPLERHDRVMDAWVTEQGVFPKDRVGASFRI